MEEYVICCGFWSERRYRNPDTIIATIVDYAAWRQKERRERTGRIGFIVTGRVA